jgi:hypothetical protein
MPAEAIMGAEFILPDQRNWGEYERFLERKSQIGGMSGFTPHWIPDWLFPFQQHLTEWAIRQAKRNLESGVVNNWTDTTAQMDLLEEDDDFDPTGDSEAPPGA